jgi:hypothetical protein
LKELIAEALRSYLERGPEGDPAETGWRVVFGAAIRREVQKVDTAVERDLEQVDPGEWR